MANNYNIKQIPIDKIKFFDTPLTTMDVRTYAGLKQHIANNGILLPILVVQDQDKYLLVDGYQRVKIAKELGITQLPAIILDMPKELAETLVYALKRWTGKLDNTAYAKMISEKENKGISRKDIIKYSAISPATLKYFLIRKTSVVRNHKCKTATNGKRTLKSVDVKDVKIPLILNLTRDEYEKVMKKLKTIDKNEKNALLKLIEGENK